MRLGLWQAGIGISISGPGRCVVAGIDLVRLPGFRAFKDLWFRVPLLPLFIPLARTGGASSVSINIGQLTVPLR